MKYHILNILKPTFLTAAGLGAAFLEIVNKYFFSDFEYLKFLVIAISLDLLTGVAKVWAKDGHKAVTSKGIRMTVLKFIQYGSFLIITHVVSSFTIAGEPYAKFAIVKNWGYVLLLLIEIKSVYENITAMNGKLDFVKWIIAAINTVLKTKPPKK